MEIEWPFRASEALEQGVTFRHLRRFHQAVHPAIWVPRGAELSLEQRIQAAWLWSGRRAVVSGLCAAKSLGAKWIDDDDIDVELIHDNRRPPEGIVVHTETLLPGEVQLVGDLRVTAPARTAVDLGRRLPVDDAVERIDALMNTTGLRVDTVVAAVKRHPRMRGVAGLREALRLVDGGAESPYETKTRLLLVRAGFPRPTTQIPVFDRWGRVFARIDMGWPEYSVGVDFEGAHHWTDARQRSRDIDRFAELPKLGWIDERLTSGILHNRPQSFLDRVGAALLSRGCPKSW